MLGGMQNQQFYFMGWRKESTPQPDLHNVSGKLWIVTLRCLAEVVGYYLENHQMTGVWRFIMTITLTWQTCFIVSRTARGIP